jgi:hypothetical protein
MCSLLCNGPGLCEAYYATVLIYVQLTVQRSWFMCSLLCNGPGLCAAYCATVLVYVQLVVQRS